MACKITNLERKWFIKEKKSSILKFGDQMKKKRMILWLKIEKVKEKKKIICLSKKKSPKESCKWKKKREILNAKVT